MVTPGTLRCAVLWSTKTNIMPFGVRSHPGKDKRPYVTQLNPNKNILVCGVKLMSSGFVHYVICP